MYNAVGMKMPPLFDGKYTAKDFVEMLKKIEPTQKINFATDVSYNFNDFELGALPQGEGFEAPVTFRSCLNQQMTMQFA